MVKQRNGKFSGRSFPGREFYQKLREKPGSEDQEGTHRQLRGCLKEVIRKSKRNCFERERRSRFNPLARGLQDGNEKSVHVS